MCCMSRQVRFGLACRASAQMPAAKGAEAEVPVCESVQLLFRSVVTFTNESMSWYKMYSHGLLDTELFVMHDS